MPSRTCPRCKLINEADVSTCDCGYDFAGGGVRLPLAVRQLPRDQRWAIAYSARSFRALILFAPLQVVAQLAARAIGRAMKTDDSGAMGVALLVTTAAALYFTVATARAAYRMVHGMRLGNPAAWAAGAVFGGFIVLAALAGRASEWCGARGLPVGLFGPRKADLERLETAADEPSRA